MMRRRNTLIVMIVAELAGVLLLVALYFLFRLPRLPTGCIHPYRRGITNRTQHNTNRQSPDLHAYGADKHRDVAPTIQAPGLYGGGR